MITAPLHLWNDHVSHGWILGSPKMLLHTSHFVLLLIFLPAFSFLLA